MLMALRARFNLPAVDIRGKEFKERPLRVYNRRGLPFYTGDDVTGDAPILCKIVARRHESGGRAIEAVERKGTQTVLKSALWWVSAFSVSRVTRRTGEQSGRMGRAKCGSKTVGKGIAEAAPRTCAVVGEVKRITREAKLAAAEV